ncbi:hypothetical protein OG21DRAFT_1414436 [Imleria badia]|nr:hypothetical protein OG21DRAFT_1414436 [Imleria badia]
MDPFQMPKAFCIVQTFVIYYSAWSLTGVCAAFTFATSSCVLWPSATTRPATATLAWKNKYYFPIFVFPLACLSISLPVLLNVNAIQPTDDLHCDASHPEWGRFLGYAGLSMILTIPCLFLSAIAARRVLQLHRDIQHSRYSFKHSTGHFHSRSQTSKERNVPSVKSPIISPGNTTPTSVDPVMLYSSQPTSPTGRADEAPCDVPAVSPPATFGALATSPTSPKRSETWEALGSLEEVVELDPRRQMGSMMLSCKSHLPTEHAPPPKPNLAPAIWRLILFQMAFFIIQCLAALSTIIDVARHQPTPTPFGSQHVALILVAWGPAVVFGHSPAVRRQLMFWKR